MFSVGWGIGAGRSRGYAGYGRGTWGVRRLEASNIAGGNRGNSFSFPLSIFYGNWLCREKGCALLRKVFETLLPPVPPVPPAYLLGLGGNTLRGGNTYPLSIRGAYRLYPGVHTGSIRGGLPPSSRIVRLLTYPMGHGMHQTPYHHCWSCVKGQALSDQQRARSGPRHSAKHIGPALSTLQRVA